MPKVKNPKKRSELTKSRNKSRSENYKQKTSRNAELKTSKLSNLSKLQQKMQDKLSGSKFRWINEQLYTSNSKQSHKMFKENKEYFSEYHKGFSNQVKSWPINPVDEIICDLKRTVRSDWKIADMGCGEAKLEEELKSYCFVYSFDLVAQVDNVVECDIANVPLESSSLDCVIFCLSLMGTNFIDFLKEANRLLKIGGIVKIAEVTSRLDSSFENLLDELGFKIDTKTLKNNFFTFFTLTKRKKPNKSISKVELKPCIYKRR